MKHLEKRLDKIEQLTPGNMNIPLKTWLQSERQQTAECEKQDITITPIKWVSTEEAES